MEERENPSTDDGKDESPPSNSKALATTCRLVPLENSETYIIQIPRDQVYRIPPPENAKIVESYRGPAKAKKKNKINFGGSCWSVILGFILIGVTVGISFAVVHSLYKPKYPTFSVTQIHVKSTRTPEYDVTLTAHNPNERMDVKYKGKAGKASLIFEKQNIAKGEAPNLTQDPKSFTNIPLVLHGTKAKISIDTKPKSMQLKIQMPVEVKSWAKTVQKGMTITCDFKVDSLLRKKNKILSQDCQTS